MSSATPRASVRRVGILVSWILRRLVNWGTLFLLLWPWLWIGGMRGAAELQPLWDALVSTSGDEVLLVEVVDRAGLGHHVVGELDAYSDLRAELVEPGAEWGEEAALRVTLGPEAWQSGTYELERRHRGRGIREEVLSWSVEHALAAEVLGPERLASLRGVGRMEATPLRRTSDASAEVLEIVARGLSLAVVPLVWALLGFGACMIVGVTGGGSEGLRELMHASRSRGEALASRVVLDLLSCGVLLLSWLPLLVWSLRGSSEGASLLEAMVTLFADAGWDPMVLATLAHAVVGAVGFAILRQGAGFTPVGPLAWPLPLAMVALPVAVFWPVAPLVLWTPDLFSTAWTALSVVPMLGLIVAFERWLAGGALLWLVASWVSSLGVTWWLARAVSRLGHADAVLGAFPRSLADLRRAWRIA